MADNEYGTIIRNGLWHNNPALVQILGLCPLLAVSSTVINALGLGIATTLTLVLTNLTVSLIAAIVTAIELAMNAYFHELYLILGIFIPLIVTNCNILARAEAFASKNAPLPSTLDGLFMGVGFTAVLVALGALRELLGKGTLFSQAQLMFGDGAKWMTLTVFHDYHGFLLAILPPGAFIGLGLLIALKNVIDARRKALPAPTSARYAAHTHA